MAAVTISNHNQYKDFDNQEERAYMSTGARGIHANKGLNARASRNQNIISKDHLLQKYSQLANQAHPQTSYVYKSPRKQVVMLQPQRQKHSFQQSAYNVNKILYKFQTGTSFFRSNQKETQDSDARLPGINNNETINSRSEDRFATSPSNYQDASPSNKRSNNMRQVRNIQVTKSPNRQRNSITKIDRSKTNDQEKNLHKRIKGNHIQNSIKIMMTEEKALLGKDKNAFNTGNFDRIGKELQKTRMGFGIRNEREELNELMRSTDSNTFKNSPDRGKQGGIKPNLNDPRFREFEQAQTEFQGQPAEAFIRSKQTEKWMTKRKTQGDTLKTNRKHIEFAQNLFISWDDDGSGVLEAEEIIKPLVGLGLSSDSKFATKILQALDSRYGSENKQKDDLKITLQDFIKIFKNDKISENLVSAINNDIQATRLQQQETQILKPPQINQRHPDIRSPRTITDSSRASNKSKITLSMKTNDQRRLVEIPLDSALDQISVHSNILDKDGSQKLRTQIFKIKGDKYLSQPFENYINVLDEQSDYNNGSDRQTQMHEKKNGYPKLKSLFGNDGHEEVSVSGAQRTIQLKNKNISLQEQMETIKAWWKSIDIKGIMTYEHPTTAVCAFMVKKRLAQDKEQASKVIFGQLGLAARKEIINFDEFNKIFCKGLFKEALIKVTNQFNQMSQTNKAAQELPLSVKISEYQRNQMFGGLDQKSESFGQGRQILNSLNEISQAENGKKQLTYQKFLDDPMGRKSKLRHEEERKNNEGDTFVDRIKFIEDTEASHHGRRPVPHTESKKKRGHKLTLLEMRQKVFQQDLISGEKDEEDKFNQNRRNESEVKIPAIYLEKNKEDRIKDQNDLLSRFQKLLSMDAMVNDGI